MCSYYCRSARIGRREVVKETLLKKKMGVASPSSEAVAPPTDSGEPAKPIPAAPPAPTSLITPKPLDSSSAPLHSKPSSKNGGISHAAATPPSGSTARRRVSSSLSHGDPSEDQYGLSQLFQPDNAPKPAMPLMIKSVPTPAQGVGNTMESNTQQVPVKEEMGVVKTEGNTFRTKFKVCIYCILGTF